MKNKQAVENKQTIVEMEKQFKECETRWEWKRSYSIVFTLKPYHQ